VSRMVAYGQGRGWIPMVGQSPRSEHGAPGASEHVQFDALASGRPRLAPRLTNKCLTSPPTRVSA
jgi:hypothetical protein